MEDLDFLERSWSFLLCLSPPAARSYQVCKIYRRAGKLHCKLVGNSSYLLPVEVIQPLLNCTFYSLWPTSQIGPLRTVARVEVGPADWERHAKINVEPVNRQQ
jgi:hypothetical protein